jgi:protein tyrosine phosphatase
MATSPTSKRSIIKNLLKGSVKVSSHSQSYTSPLENGNRKPTEEDLKEFLDMVEVGEYSRRQFRGLDQLQATREGQDDHRCSREAGDKATALGLNRYSNILPYNHSRIRIRPTNPSYGASADYINASEVYTPSKHRRYIATQGPKESTIEDFWRMVWDNVSKTKEEEVSTILMLTQLIEDRSRKCDQYWPETVNSSFDVAYRDEEGGDITLDVRLVSQEENTAVDTVISTIQLSSRPSQASPESEPQPRYTIKHLLYRGWRDMDIPEPRETFLEFFRLYRRSHTSTASPIVHCSAGCGRTGVFIALDYLFTQAPSMKRQEILEDPVFQTVNELRRWRGNMVFRPGQLQYIYDLFAEMARGNLSLSC